MTPTPRPDPNVLDLRKLAAERRLAAEHGRTWSRRPSRTSVSSQPLTRPTAPPRDWVRFRRELWKFGVVIGVVGVLSGLTIITTSALRAKHAIEQQASTGAHEFQLGLAHLGAGQSAEAEKSFTAARDAFTQARSTTDRSFPAWLERAPLVGVRLATGKNIITTGRDIADAGQRLSALLPATIPSQPAVTIQSDGIIQGSFGVLPAVLERREDFVAVVGQAVQSLNTLSSLPPSAFPKAYREQAVTWQRLVHGLVGTGDTLEQITNVLLAFVAPKTEKEFLVIFQNNNELRPTGGFPGTYLLVQFSKGGFKILDAPGNGPYALSDLVAKKNLPPQPLLSLVPFWTFHDANWYLDVPSSAKTLLEMYAQDRGFTPDGVMFLTPSIMEDLLRITGPIRPDKYAVDITAENFVAATEQQVEFGYDKAKNNPKQFLIDLVPLMLMNVAQLDAPNAVRAAAITLKHAQQQDMMFYSGDAETQHVFSSLGWDGGLLTNTEDYLAVVDTNLGGGKTDRTMDENVSVEISENNGMLQHEVTIRRQHNGVGGSPLNTMTNKSFIRVYAPASAQFISVTGASQPTVDFFKTPEPGSVALASMKEYEGQTLYDANNGIRITNENGKKVFGAWSMIEVGKTQTLTFTYTTPLPTDDTWSFDWQHQPGAPMREWKVAFTAPKGKAIRSVDASGQVHYDAHTLKVTTDSAVNRRIVAQLK